MKGFYWGKTAIQCGFCGMRGHNITTCPAVDKYADLALDKITKIPSYICNAWEHSALLEIKKREERKAKLRKPKKLSRCSYCKRHGHKRPSCKYLKSFRKMVYKANKNWKRLFVERVNQLGLGIGCLVQFDPQTVRNLEFNVMDNHIAMITRYNLNNLNVFCAFDSDSSKYQSNSTISILSGDRTDEVSVKYLGWLMGNELLHTGWWYQSAPPKVLNPMPWEPAEEWMESEWDEVFNWFFNDINESDMGRNQLLRFIEEWADKI